MLADFAAEIAAGHVVVIEVARAVEGYLISWPKKRGSVQNLSHFRLAERHPALAHAVMAPLICWSFSNSVFRYRLVDHAVPAMWRSLAAARLSAEVVSRIFRTGSVQNLSHFRLAERHPALAHAVMAPLICWSFSNSMFRYLLDDHAVPAMWRSLAAGSAARLRRRPRSFSITRMAFSRAAARSSLAWIALSMAAISRTLVEGT